MKRKPMLSIIGLLVGSMIAVAGCSANLSRTFYQHHPRSLQDVEKDWGEPVKVTLLENDIEKRVYPIQSPYTDLKYRYFLFRDDMVLASGLTDIGREAPAKVHQQSVGFNPSDLSKAFYANNRTTVAHIDSTWGEPLRVKDMSDGTQVRVYAIQDPYTDFNFRKFIVKDGIVVASRISPEKGFSSPPGQSETCCIEINELSNRYYRNHPMSLESVKQVWGEPVLIEKDDNGLEKWVYELKMPVDAGFSFRFFVIDDGMVVSSGVRDTLDIAAN
ncbi:hypothetical protein [Desulfosarcina sp.]|uniref:hypothetical protein n=1 Tax=Desulfosarcina sp. TaxID=2027861 RepID=UPI0039707C9C